jgi:hypothetical protein
MKRPTLEEQSRQMWYLVTLPIWSWPLGWWCAYSSWSGISYVGHFLLTVNLFVVMLCLGAVLALVVGPIVALIPKYRRFMCITMLQSVVLILCFIGGMILGQKVWRKQVEAVVARGDVLVKAIQQYEAKYGDPPLSLDALVPDFLPEVTMTGIGLRSDFQYTLDQPKQYDGNPWVLVMIPPCAPMGFDSLMYFPKQNYPKHGYGGGIERMGAWGYVHE